MAKLKSIKSLIHDNVLVCLKEERKNGIRLRVTGRPDIEVKAATLRKAEELLLLQLWEADDFDEPIGIRYERAKPAPVASEEQLYVVVPNEVADAVNPGSYFKDGFCATCQSGLGGRNPQILQLQRAPRSSSSGGIVRFQPFLKCGRRVSPIIIHLEICKILKNQPLLQFRAIEAKQKRLENFRELVPAMTFSDVLPLAYKEAAGGKCPKCRQTHLYLETGSRYLSMAAAQEIRSQGAAAIGDLSSPSLCVTQRIWNRIKKSKYARGLIDYAVTELDEAAINMKPKLEKIVPF